MRRDRRERPRHGGRERDSQAPGRRLCSTELRPGCAQAGLVKAEPGADAGSGAAQRSRLDGERGGHLGYAMWRRYLKLAHGYTAAHPDGIVKYTAHEVRHVCASLLIASGASDMQVAYQMGHTKIETTKNIYGHLFASDRAEILGAMNQAVSRLYAYEKPGD